MKESFRHISNRKALGCDGIPIEFLKSGGDEDIRVMTSQCNSIWKTKIWPNDRKKSIYVPIYKKSDTKKMWKLQNIRQISHESKVLLRILQKILDTVIIPELPIEQVVCLRGRGTRDHVANLIWMMEKARDHQRELFS